MWAVVRNGKIKLLSDTPLPEGSKLLVTIFPEEKKEFWLEASQDSLKAIWDNDEDNIYAQLLEK
jgi:hypothetical protein